MGWFIAIIKGLLVVGMIVILGDFFYRMITERDIERSWKAQAILDIIDFIIYLILFIGLQMGW